MAVTPDSHTFLNGVLDSSELNTYVRDPIRFHFTKPIVELKQIVAQSLVTATWTPVTFTSEVVDTDPDSVGGHSTSVNTSRFTPTYAGWYLLGGGVGFAANATNQRATRWAVNGAVLDGSSVFSAAGNLFETSVPARTKLVFLSTSDYLELHAWQNSGGALLTIATGEHSCSLTAAWMRNA